MKIDLDLICPGMSQHSKRVQALRDKAMVSKQSVSQKRKETWDAKAQDRTFTKVIKS